MDYEIKIINDAVNNTINGNYPNIEWGFNNKIKDYNTYNNYLLCMIITLLLWCIMGILISIIKRKKIILSILMGPLIINT